MSEVTLTDANFAAEVLNAEGPVLVDFWAPWCGPCQQMGPVVEELAAAYAGKMKVGKLNVDDNQETAGKYQVLSIPTFLVFNGGEVVDKLVGGVAKDKLKELVDKNLA